MAKSCYVSGKSHHRHATKDGARTVCGREVKVIMGTATLVNVDCAVCRRKVEI